MSSLMTSNYSTTALYITGCLHSRMKIQTSKNVQLSETSPLQNFLQRHESHMILRRVKPLYNFHLPVKNVRLPSFTYLFNNSYCPAASNGQSYFPSTQSAILIVPAQPVTQRSRVPFVQLM